MSKRSHLFFVLAGGPSVDTPQITPLNDQIPSLVCVAGTRKYKSTARILHHSLVTR